MKKKNLCEILKYLFYATFPYHKYYIISSTQHAFFGYLFLIKQYIVCAICYWSHWIMYQLRQYNINFVPSPTKKINKN